jgi:hypothetical protein
MAEEVSEAEVLAEYRAEIAKAAELVRKAYWGACYKLERAVHPDELEPDNLDLDGYYDIALRMEDMIEEGDAADWDDATTYF